MVANRLSKTDLLGLAAIKEGFERVAGEEFAAHATPLRLEGGVLRIGVDQPAWATQIKLNSERLRAPLAEIGKCRIDRIEVVVRAP